MEIKLKTLTPIWTGGVDQRCDRIHETGLIGSLRWWYEALVRGLGGWACDPSKHECPDENGNYCYACQVFGAKGLRRRFRLTAEDQTQKDTSSHERISAKRTNPKTKKNPTWWFPDNPRSGNFTIQVQGLIPGFRCETIGGLMQFVADWAAIGAKAQMGFGVFEPVNERFDTRPLYDCLVATAEDCRYSNLPSLQNIFLARIQMRDSSDQDTFDLKYDLRQLFRDSNELRHFIMGTVKGERMAAKVKMSRPYAGGLMRVWGWIPEKADEYRKMWDRNKVVGTIYKHLRKEYTVLVWREMNSLRDSVAPNNPNPQAFLRSLLSLREENDEL